MKFDKVMQLTLVLCAVSITGLYIHSHYLSWRAQQPSESHAKPRTFNGEYVINQSSVRTR